MKKKIISYAAILFAFAMVSINSTAHEVSQTKAIHTFSIDTTPPMSHPGMKQDKNKMNKSKNKMMGDSMNHMQNGDSSLNSPMDSTHR